MDICRLDGLNEGEWALVVRLEASGGIRRRLQDIGLVPGGRVGCIARSPLGDPTAYDVCGAVIALRGEEASKIYVARDVQNGSD